jgi:hypothetical protein
MSGDFSLLDAQKAYKGFGCSHYFMCREDPDLYARYRALGVSREQEIQWSEEALQEDIEGLMDPATPADRLWSMHSNATRLAENVNSIGALRSLYLTSQAILESVPENDSILCAESILARNDVGCRSGPVFMSSAMGEPALASAFLDLARKFANRYSRRDVERYASAIRRAETIASMIAADGTALPSKAGQTLQRVDKRPLAWRAFLLAPLASIPALTILGLGSSDAGIGSEIFMGLFFGVTVGLPIAYAAMFIAGLPIYLLLRRLKLVRLWIVCAIGIIVPLALFFDGPARITMGAMGAGLAVCVAAFLLTPEDLRS